MAKVKGASVGLRNNKMIYAVIGVLLILVFFGTLTLLKSIYQTTTYYVLNTDVTTRAQILPEMLDPVVTAAGTEPIGFILESEAVQEGRLFARHPIEAGSLLTLSNVSDGFDDIRNGVPDNWVITSFSVNADSAVGGRIQRGMYFDVMVADGAGSYYPFINVLALDTTVELANSSNSEAAETEEAHAGMHSQYVVGMSPKDAAILHNIMAENASSFKLVLSPRQNDYKAPLLSDYNGVFTFDGETKNLGVGTDSNFTQLKRDVLGRPLETLPICSEGNSRPTAEECQEAQNPSSTTTENNDSNTEADTNTETETEVP